VSAERGVEGDEKLCARFFFRLLCHTMRQVPLASHSSSFLLGGKNFALSLFSEEARDVEID
jgi:hypothetical protein